MNTYRVYTSIITHSGSSSCTYFLFLRSILRHHHHHLSFFLAIINLDSLFWFYVHKVLQVGSKTEGVSCSEYERRTNFCSVEFTHCSSLRLDDWEQLDLGMARAEDVDHSVDCSRLGPYLLWISLLGTYLRPSVSSDVVPYLPHASHDEISLIFEETHPSFS